MKTLLQKMVAKLVEGYPVGDEPLEGKNVERLSWRKFSRASEVWAGMSEEERAK